MSRKARPDLTCVRIRRAISSASRSGVGARNASNAGCRKLVSQVLDTATLRNDSALGKADSHVGMTAQRKRQVEFRTCERRKTVHPHRVNRSDSFAHNLPGGFGQPARSKPESSPLQFLSGRSRNRVDGLAQRRIRQQACPRKEPLQPLRQAWAEIPCNRPRGQTRDVTVGRRRPRSRAAEWHATHPGRPQTLPRID